MADQKQIGIYWGHSHLFFVETVASKLIKFFNIPLDQAKPSQSIDDKKFIASSMQLVTGIESQLKLHKINAPSVNLSLPSKDIIFRSFVIPWMTPNEMKGVVTFEASKYVPFSLEELKYSYHPMTVTINNVKKLRIIFAAIKKETLENYTNILESCDLQVNVIEPSPQSILRNLIYSNQIELDKITAIVQKGDAGGNIVIVDQGIPQFVREFQLRGQNKEPAKDPAEIMLRLINEIRISIDYFSRQDNWRNVSEIKILTLNKQEEPLQQLTTDLNIPVSIVPTETILHGGHIDNLAYLNAFGVTLASSIATVSSFNLSKKESKKARLSTPSSPKMEGFGAVSKTLSMCVVFLGLVFFAVFKISDQPKKTVMQLEQDLGAFKDAETLKIKEQVTTYNTHLDYYKNIRTGSNVAFFLTTLPNLLPEGTWIKKMEVAYPDNNLITENPDKITKPIVNVFGYAYSENAREQFQLVNKLLKNIKDEPRLSKLFTNINLDTVRAEQLEDYTVTYYEIRCQ
jgi:hypothetical protein